jgi:hypothetical protein
MRSKNQKSLTEAEKNHLEAVKNLSCSLCDAEGPSEAHHVKQGQQYTTVALCIECHRGSSGWHGTKALWRIKKMDELSALNVTIQRVLK